MILARHMHKVKVEKQNPSNPSVHGVIRLNVRIIQHPFIFCVDFQAERWQAHQMNPKSLEGTENPM
jgi:hypothetical protein